MEFINVTEFPTFLMKKIKDAKTEPEAEALKQYVNQSILAEEDRDEFYKAIDERRSEIANGAPMFNIGNDFFEKDISDSLIETSFNIVDHLKHDFIDYPERAEEYKADYEEYRNFCDSWDEAHPEDDPEYRILYMPFCLSLIFKFGDIEQKFEALRIARIVHTSKDKRLNDYTSVDMTKMYNKVQDDVQKQLSVNPKFQWYIDRVDRETVGLSKDGILYQYRYIKGLGTEDEAKEALWYVYEFMSNVVYHTGTGHKQLLWRGRHKYFKRDTTIDEKELHSYSRQYAQEEALSKL